MTMRALVRADQRSCSKDSSSVLALIARRRFDPNRDGDHSATRRFGTSFLAMEDSHER